MHTSVCGAMKTKVLEHATLAQCGPKIMLTEYLASFEKALLKGNAKREENTNQCLG